MSYHSILRNSRAVPPYPVLYNFHKFNAQCSFQEGEEGAREGVSYYHILSPKPPLSFQQQSIISLCRLGEKKGSVSNLQSSHQGNDGKIYRENSTFPET